jgi:hypothetical protein
MDETARQRIRRVAEAHGSGLGSLLQTGSDMNSCAEYVLNTKLSNPASPKNYFPEMDSDADFDPFRWVSCEAIPNSKPRETGPDRVVFTCRRGSENCHDTVTSVAGRSLKALHLFNHRSNCGTEEVGSVFRIEVLNKLCRSLNVSK